MTIGNNIHALATELFPICRSLTGDGVRQTLAILQRELPELRTVEVPSGTACFDWQIPPEWKINKAYVIDPTGKKILDFEENNLHVLGYSDRVDKHITLDELQEHLYSLPDRPDAIPYVTSYYQKRWGFCIAHQLREKLIEGNYHVYIDSQFDEQGSLTFGELVLPGITDEEILISTYICHPSLANNELSGPTVATHIAIWLSSLTRRRYTYRLVFVPETIGSICYISRNFDHLRRHVVAGFVLTCIGDERCFSYLPTRNGSTLSDKVARHVLKHFAPEHLEYSYLDRESDERQYNAPGVDLPIASLMRSKYGTYPEYHTSLDDLDLITPDGLAGGYEMVRLCLLALEHNETLSAVIRCEPNLGKRGMYPTLGVKIQDNYLKDMTNLLGFCDGTNSLLDVATEINRPVWELSELVDRLKKENLLTSS